MSNLPPPTKKAPAKRQPKKKPTPAEVHALLITSLAELQVIHQQLVEEKVRIPVNLPRVTEVIDDALLNLEEDMEEMQEQLDEYVDDPTK